MLDALELPEELEDEFRRRWDFSRRHVAWKKYCAESRGTESS